MITTKMFTSKKDAKAEIKRLVKEAEKMAKQKRYGDAVLCYETASVTASNWKMPEDSKRFRNRALNAQIAAFNDKIRKGKREVPKLLRQGEDERALNYCEEAYEAASSMFKLGFTEYEKTVKKFGGMLQDVRKNLKSYESSSDAIFRDDKKHFEKMERDLLKKAIKAEKEKKYDRAVTSYSELTVIANKIFKFGVISAKDKIKKYKAKVVKLKRKALKAAEEGISNLKEDELLDQKAQFLNIALEAEQTQDYLRAIVAYEEAIKIQHKLGDHEGATNLEEKIHTIVSNIPNVERVLSDLLHRATTHFDQQTYDLAFSEFQYALGICKALGKQDQVIEITAKLDEISRRL
jgi:tetratricopeptide (TPR) repeat protein